MLLLYGIERRKEQAKLQLGGRIDQNTHVYLNVQRVLA
jgi:hypothetical protein|tara:strand:- start:212 stop:325 length:114 start_codon:yes stop_codon:yes gene_type:complete